MRAWGSEGLIEIAHEKQRESGCQQATLAEGHPPTPPTRSPAQRVLASLPNRAQTLPSRALLRRQNTSFV